MRLTIKIDRRDQAMQPSFAVLWLDTEEQLWSREAHQGIDLPTWGMVKDVEGAIALCSADSGEAVCRLQGLSFDAIAPVAWSGRGKALLASQQAEGDWRLQAVETGTVQPETRGFTVVR
jgi:hypothetical protein